MDRTSIISTGIVVMLIVIIFWAGSQSGNWSLPRLPKKSSTKVNIYISTAANRFYADYGRLPLPVTGAPATGDLDTDTGTLNGLVAVLIGKEPAGPTLQNPSGTNYLEGIMPARPGKKPNGPPWVNGLTFDPSLYSVVDAWGNPYRVRLDANHDKEIANPNLLEVAEGRKRLSKLAIVWSAGGDKNWDTWEDNPKSWD